MGTVAVAFPHWSPHPDVWLIVRNDNLRAQAVYRKLGFFPFQPGDEEATRFDAVAEAPADRCFRMARRTGVRP